MIQRSYGTITHVSGAPAPRRLTTLGAADIRIRHPARFRGYACRYGKPFIDDDGGVSVFWLGCFAKSLSELIAGERTIRLLADHDETKLMATTEDRLVVTSDASGLAFDVEVPNTKIADLIGDRRELSVGCRVEKFERKRFSNTDVRVITSAILEEISFVRKGAVSGTCGYPVEHSFVVSLEDDARGKTLPANVAANAFGAALSRLSDALRRVS